MKTRKSVNEVVEVSDGGCCGAVTVDAAKNEACCEQPSNGTSCCDKSEPKEVNSEKTGCC